jgi:hypothetical protein
MLNGGGIDRAGATKLNAPSAPNADRTGSVFHRGHGAPEVRVREHAGRDDEGLADHLCRVVRARRRQRSV